MYLLNMFSRLRIFHTENVPKQHLNILLFKNAHKEIRHVRSAANKCIAISPPGIQMTSLVDIGVGRIYYVNTFNILKYTPSIHQTGQIKI